jgi:hypothetical protein
VVAAAAAAEGGHGLRSDAGMRAARVKAQQALAEAAVKHVRTLS